VVVAMNSAPRFFARSLLTLAVLTTSLSAPAARPAAKTPTQDTPSEQSIAGIRPEGRLRKLHLVRPDLIPYPIAYEVYC
jgi:hypothetical protein